MHRVRGSTRLLPQLDEQVPHSALAALAAPPSSDCCTTRSAPHLHWTCIHLHDLTELGTLVSCKHRCKRWDVLPCK